MPRSNSISENEKCAADLEMATCIRCSRLAEAVVRSTLADQGLEGVRLGVLTEMVQNQTLKIVDFRFPADKVVAPEFVGRLTCEDRTAFVTETAVELAVQSQVDNQTQE